MNTQASQDAYARYDITNILSGYDVDWAERINKNAAIAPSLYQRFQAAIDIDELTAPNGEYIQTILKNKMSPIGRSKFKANLLQYKECSVFFYGNICVTGRKGDGSVVIPPIMVVNQVSFCDRGVTTVISAGTDYDAPNAIMYGAQPLANICSNHLKLITQIGGPERWEAGLLLDGIVVGVPETP